MEAGLNWGQPRNQPCLLSLQLQLYRVISGPVIRRFCCPCTRCESGPPTAAELSRAAPLAAPLRRRSCCQTFDGAFISCSSFL